MKYFEGTGVIGVIAVFAAAGAWLCAHGHAHNPSDTLLFGTGIPVALFGLLGYLFIAVTALVAALGWTPQWVQTSIEVLNHVAVAFATLFTIYLVWKSIQVGLACPGCWLCWGINVYLGLSLIKHLVNGQAIVS